jgi:adenylylsulfate kinase-like enzyme
VHVDASLETCESRDVKGLYQKARAGEIPEFTGISAPYEAPENPELVLDTNEKSVEESVEAMLRYLDKRG